MGPYPALPAPRGLHARNLGRRRGPKPPLELREIWAIRIRLQLEGMPAVWPYSIWQSTVNSAAAIWCACWC